MILRVSDAGDGILNDAVNLAEARLMPADSRGEADAIQLSDLLRVPRPAIQRRIEGAGLPIVVNTTEQAGLLYTQRTFVAPAGDGVPTTEVGKDRAVCVVEFLVENRSQESRSATAWLGFAPDKAGGEPLSVEASDGKGKIRVRQQGQLLASVETREGTLMLAGRGGRAQVSGDLEPKEVARWVVSIPTGVTQPGALLAAADPAVLRERVARHWDAWLRRGMQIEVPDPLVDDVYRATQVHCLMAARNEDHGRLIAPWIASDAYGPLDTEAQPVILGMDLVGHDEFARRSLDFFISSYNADGLLAKGYTLMGTGQHLWTLAEHYALTRDAEWLAGMRAEILRSCRWIVRQTEKTKRLDAARPEAAGVRACAAGRAGRLESLRLLLLRQRALLRRAGGCGRVLAEIEPPDARDPTRGGRVPRERPAGVPLAAGADAGRAAARRRPGFRPARRASTASA